MKCSELCLVAALGAIAACGGANAGPLIPAEDGGSGGAGGTPPTEQGVFRLNCDYENETLQLSFRIELLVEILVEITEPFSRSSSTEATFSASVTLESVASLIEALTDAGLPTVIDIASASVTTNVTGATPATMTASLVEAPILGFDLQTDPDDDGSPGPHRLELDPVTATANATAEATEVVFGLEFGGISLTLGDFGVPSNCADRSLMGIAVRFPVGR